jgi:uncharacterized protein
LILPDVNVLIYAHREDAVDHAAYHGWLRDVLEGPNSYGTSDLVLNGFIRIVTSRRIFTDPTPLDDAIAFANLLRSRRQSVAIRPGARHWEIYESLLRTASARGNLVADAYLAALAIEAGCEWVTTDRDFARFPGLKWRHPLQ